jgi:hypothetical protein
MLNCPLPQGKDDWSWITSWRSRVMLSTQNIEAELSYAYLHAVASRTGVICELGGRHSDAAGVDATLRVAGPPLSADSILTRFIVEVQLKATRREPAERGDHYPVSLPIKNYDELRSTTAVAPQLLVVLFLPNDPNQWLTHGEEQLITRRCAYWASLHGAPPSENDTSQTVYVPRGNQLSVTGLLNLLTRFSRREVVSYAN